MRLFFVSISKTNKTEVDDHVIAEAPAGLSPDDDTLSLSFFSVAGMAQ